MKNISLSILVIILFQTNNGCMTVELSTKDINQAISMTSNVNKDYKILKHFKRELTGVFTFFNLVTLADPNVSYQIKKDILANKGDGIINLTIIGQTSFYDQFIPFMMSLVGGLVIQPYGTMLGAFYSQRTYIIEGDIISYNKNDSIGGVEQVVKENKKIETVVKNDLPPFITIELLSDNPTEIFNGTITLTYESAGWGKSILSIKGLSGFSEDNNGPFELRSIQVFKGKSIFLKPDENNIYELRFENEIYNKLKISLSKY